MADDDDVNYNSTTVSESRNINQHNEEVHNYDYIFINNHHSTSEIEEVDENTTSPLTPIAEDSATIDSSVFSYDINGVALARDRRDRRDDDDEEEDAMYVVVEEKEGSQSSMDALMWALKGENSTAKIVYLIHVFPEIKFIPSPLGNGRVPKSQVRQDQVENYMVQERAKRRQFLQKFIDKCVAHKVKAETILIESDNVAKAVSELLLVLNVKKLVVGVSKSNLRKLRSRKGNGVAVQILENAPHWCEIKFICEGKDALEDQDTVALAAVGTPSPQHASVSGIDHAKSPSPTINGASHQSENQQHRDSYRSYCCFKPNVANE